MRCIECGNVFHSSQGVTVDRVCADCEAQVIAEIMACSELYDDIVPDSLTEFHFDADEPAKFVGMLAHEGNVSWAAVRPKNRRIGTQ